MPAVYGDIVQPEDGVIVHGLFLDAGRWDSEKMTLADPYPGKKFDSFLLFLGQISHTFYGLVRLSVRSVSVCKWRKSYTFIICSSLILNFLKGLFLSKSQRLVSRKVQRNPSCVKTVWSDMLYKNKHLFLYILQVISSYHSINT